MSATYVPGQRAVLVGPTAVVVAAAEHIDELARLAGAADPNALGVIHLLSGGDLTRLPDFACVVATDDDIRAVVRGRFRISCGDWCLDGLGAATWHEQPVVRAHGDAITVQALDDDQPAGQQLPLRDGVVLGAAVTWRPEGATTAAPLDETPTQVRIAPAQPPEIQDIQDIPVVAPVVVPPPPAPTQISAPPAPGPAPAQPPYDSDHDGHTITAAQLEAMRADARTTPPPAQSVTPAEPAEPSRPRVIVQVPGHADVTMRKSVLIGRSPRATQTSSAQLPALVVVDDLYVSGTHVEIRFDGDVPVVIDRSRNGTVITHIGQAPEQLTKDVPTPLSDGAMLALSDQVSARVRIGST